MAKAFLVKRWFLVGSVMLLATGNVEADTSVCGPSISIPVGDGLHGVEIDKVWSGATVTFDAVARNGKTYFGYYDADRWLAVAQFDSASGIVCRTRLTSQYAGWDSHNIIALAFDGDGQLHVAGNMHSSPLVYGAAASSDSIKDITLAPMIGRDEKKVTYPIFINSSDGKLYFSYRSGDSGNGEWVVNVRDDQKWKRTLDGPIFSSVWDSSPTSAYPTPFRVYQDGFIHIAAVWRRTSDVASNYAITYARTRDFIHWEDHNGQPITPPMNPGNSDMIDAPGEGKGLVNAARVGITTGGKPIVAYTKYGPDGKNSIVLASPSRDGWHQSIIATAEQRNVIAGGGSVPNLPTIGDLYVYRGELGRITVAFPGEKQKLISFETDTLRVVDAPKSDTKPAVGRNLHISPPQGLADIRRNSRSVRVDGSAEKTAGSIVYFSQGVNRDSPRKCTLKQPTACAPPPSPLIFIP
ncbi:BNR repeat-containing protein [Agrobacterium pusense]|uniref:BNR repeat-containing protein n=1 Tax=Agrobacterium pusense TaxID=648995 RepID=UPI000D19DB11|nr:BNR repeat-containing protein [Agrobacterium pusense]